MMSKVFEYYFVNTVALYRTSTYLDWDRGGALFLPTFHLVSSTIKLNGGISAGSIGSSLLKISANSVQRVRNPHHQRSV